MQARPNILWIVTTQWRAQACGFAGDPNARTPCLDAFAAQSINFTQAVTPHPFGPFARAAMLTGVPSPENGVADYFDPLPVLSEQRLGNRDQGLETRGQRVETAERGTRGIGGESRRLSPGRTIAHEMNERGYTTAFFGKWHLAKRDSAAPLVGEAHAKMIVPAEQRGGFGFWEGFESGFLLNDPWLHGTRLPEPVRLPGYQSEVVGRRAAEWIAECRSPSAELIAPWFCVVSLEAPHPPYDAPANGVRPCDPEKIALPSNVPRGREAEIKARRELAGYYAHIQATDAAIGRLIRDVDAHAVRCGLPMPIVVLTSVHGDMHGAHGLFRKGWPYEESVRVPLLVRLPPPARQIAEDRSQIGRRSEELVSLLDLPRWTLAWADGVFDRPTAGADLRNSAQQISMPSVVALPYQCDRVWRGVRTASRKLVLNDDGSPWLFFDLEADPFELRNLAADASHADEIAELRRMLMKV